MTFRDLRHRLKKFGSQPPKAGHYIILWGQRQFDGLVIWPNWPFPDDECWGWTSQDMTVLARQHLIPPDLARVLLRLKDEEFNRPIDYEEEVPT